MTEIENSFVGRKEKWYNQRYYKVKCSICSFLLACFVGRKHENC